MAASDRRCFAAGYVRGMRCHVKNPPLQEEPERFIKWLMSYLAGHSVSMLIPLGDAGTDLIARHQDEIRRYTRLYLPPYDRFLVAHDKIRTNQAAEKAGVAIPRCWYPGAGDVETVIREATWPVLVKPGIGVGARGIVRANTPEELRSAWVTSQNGCFVQEMIPLTGSQYVVDILIDEQARTVAAVASKKVRFYPVSGGASTLSQTVHRPDLCDATERLLRAIGYHGVANVDFIEDPRDGVPKLLEINPRFGEMHGVCSAAGVDLPWLLYRAAHGEKLPYAATYPAGVSMRFSPTDLMWFLKSSDRFRAKPGFWESLMGNKVAHTLIQGSDFGPVVGYLLENLALLGDPKKFAYRFRRR